MGNSFGCKCEERSKPVDERAWIVLSRNCNHSAFSGYRRTPSAYSEVACLRCRSIGRTKAAYVAKLKDGTWNEWETTRVRVCPRCSKAALHEYVEANQYRCRDCRELHTDCEWGDNG
jgi:hypothetical protein